MPDFRNKPVEIFHSIHWIEEHLNPGNNNKMDQVLALKDSRGKVDPLLQKLREEGANIIEIEFGPDFKKIGVNHYVINVSEPNSRRLFTEVNLDAIDTIIHSGGLAAPVQISCVSELNETLNQGADSLFYLIKALAGAKLSHPLNIAVITSYGNEVTGTEKRINPENAVLLGLGRTVPRECPELNLKCIDIDEPLRAEKIVAELRYRPFSGLVAYRDGRRYVEEFKETDLNGLPSGEIRIKEAGTYVVTGGAGGIGLETAAFLASKNKVKLVLINRTPLPGRNQWEQVLRSGNDEQLRRKIAKIKTIESNGSNVVCYPGNIANFSEMCDIFADLEQKFGGINGIIHCAGVAGEGLITQKNVGFFHEVLAPKVQGTWILEKLSEFEALDFFILFSSTASVFGGPGQADYAAANAYLDSFASYMRKKGKKATAINWVLWKETGMAADHGVNIDVIFKALPTRQAMIAFEEILARDSARIFAGEINYGNEYARLLDRFGVRLSETIKTQLFNKSL